jgi:hypothetical protein
MNKRRKKIWPMGSKTKFRAKPETSWSAGKLRRYPLKPPRTKAATIENPRAFIEARGLADSFNEANKN